MTRAWMAGLSGDRHGRRESRTANGVKRCEHPRGPILAVLGLVLWIAGCHTDSDVPPSSSAPAALSGAPDAGGGKDSSRVNGETQSGGNQVEQGAGVSQEPVHELDPTRQVLPTTAVHGRLGGVAVNPQASIEGEYLIFRVSKERMTERALWLKLRSSPGQPLPQGRFVYGLSGAVGNGLPNLVPEVLLELPGQPLQLFPLGQYALTLELEPRRKGQVRGKIHISLADAAQSFLAGTFTAAAPRQPTEPPEVEDVPFINGTVTVRNVAPGSVLMTGYAAHPTGEHFPLAAVEIELTDSAEPLRWEQRDYDTPRLTSLIAGDVRQTPSRFEHSRLTPGRYIVFARLRNGPVAWQWVDVREQSTRKVDLVLDAQQAGGLEVIAPVGVLGKVQLAPADPQRPHMDEPLLLGLALQLGLEQDLVLRKALFKNLGPGTYVVRVGGEIRLVEVTAGKTVEVDFERR